MFTDCKRVPIIGTFLAFWVPIYISGSLFSVFWLHSREECRFSLHVYNNELSHEAHHLCSLEPSFAHENCLNICRHWFRVTLLANFDFPHAYALNFINCCFGPYFGCWGSLLGPYFTKWVPIVSLSQSRRTNTGF